MFMFVNLNASSLSTAFTPAILSLLRHRRLEVRILWRCTSLGFQIKETRYLRSIARLASANENGGSFSGQDDSLVAVSADSFLVAQDNPEEVGNAAIFDLYASASVFFTSV